MKVLVCAVLLVGTAFAQSTSTASTASVAEPPVPVLTHAEQEALDQYDKDIADLFEKMAILQQKRNAFVNALSSEHYGFYWHDAKQKGETSGFKDIRIFFPKEPPKQ